MLWAIFDAGQHLSGANTRLFSPQDAFAAMPTELQALIGNG